MKYIILTFLLSLAMSCNNSAKIKREPQIEIPVEIQVDSSVIAMWNNYTDAHSEDTTTDLPDSWFFHNNKTDANYLANLVVSGKKQAGSGLYIWYKDAGAPLPEIGTKHIITNYDGKAQAIILITKVDTIPFNKITSAYASLDMGANIESLKKWKQAHRNFFTSALNEDGATFSEDMLVVCEQFETIWPESTPTIPPNKVTLALKNSKFTLSTLPDIVTVAMYNTTPAPIITGLHYNIERYEGAQWKPMVPEMVFNDIGYGIGQNDSQTFTINLLKNRITYEKGTYRIIKRYLDENYSKTRTQYRISAQFEIE